jgi:hypothetical protein
MMLNLPRRDALTCFAIAILLTVLVINMDAEKGAEHGDWWDAYPVAQEDPSFPKKTHFNRVITLDSGRLAFLTSPTKDGTRWLTWVSLDGEKTSAYPAYIESIDIPSLAVLKSAAQMVVKSAQQIQTGYLASMAHASVNGFVGRGIGGAFEGTGHCISWATHIHDNPAARAAERVKLYADEWLLNPAHSNAPIIKACGWIGVFSFYTIVTLAIRKFFRFFRVMNSRPKPLESDS